MAASNLKKAIGNNASTTTSTSITDSDTALPLTSDTNFQSDSGKGLVIIDEGESSQEYAYSTGLSGGSLTIPLVNRGLYGTSAVGHGSNASVRGVLTAEMFNSIIDHLISFSESDITLADNTTNDVSTTKHGFVPKAPNDTTKFLRGDGTWATTTSSSNGWISDSNTWTYASASTFTISGDQTATFTKGTRLKFTQTTTKYAVVVSSSYGAPNTTVTIAVNTDYTIANAAITSPNYSYQTNPQGYPGWFAYTPTYAGFSANPTFTARFRIDGNMCTFTHVVTGDGTSNATTKTITLPVAPLNSQEVGALTAVKDNGSYSTGAGHYKFTAGNATASVFKNLIEVAWTSSGACNWSTAATAYEF